MSAVSAPKFTPAPAAKSTAKLARVAPPAKALVKSSAASLPVYLRQPGKPTPGNAATGPLDASLRGQFEARFQQDFASVRVHRDASGPIASTVPGARAVTVGNDIYFAPGKYDPASKQGRALLAHELTHVLQQRETPSTSSTRTGKNNDRFETEARRNAEAVHTGGTLAVRELGAPGGPQPDDAQAKAADQEEEYHPGFIARQVLKLFPELQPVLEHSVLEWLKDKVVTAVQTVVDTVMEPIRAIGNFAQEVGEGVSELVGWIKKAATSVAKGDCSVLHEAVDYIEQAISKLMHRVFDPLVDLGKKIGSFFSGLWDKFGAPIWDTLKRWGGAAWQKIKDIAGWIWEKAQPVINWLKRAWNWIKDKLGIGDGPDGQNGLLQWVEAKAQKAWDLVKDRIEPIKKPLLVIGGILVMLSPAGPIILIGLAIGGVIEGVRAIKRYLGPRDGIVSAREILKTVVLPSMIKVIKGFSQTLADKAHSMLGAIKGAHDAVVSAARAAQESIFSFLAGLLQFIADRIDDLVKWGNTLVEDFLSWIDRVTGGFAGFLDKILSALDAIGGVLHDIMKLPFLLMGKIWNAVPACIRDPFVDFFGVQILGRIAIFKTIAGTPEAWAKTKSDVHEIIKTIFIDFDLVGAMKKTFKLLLRVLDVPMELLTAVLGKMADAWDTIKDKPVDFLKNLLRTLKLSFKGFFKNILKHLANGLTGWLTMQLKGTGVTLPKNWLDPGEIFGFVASILGLSVDHVFERLALKLDPETVKNLRSRFNILTGAWEWIKLVITGQWGALWDKIKESLANLGSLVMDTIMDWVVENVVDTVMLQLTATADPTGISEVVVFLVDTYRTIKTVVQYMRQILTMMNTMLDSILGIAAGVLQPAADLIETAFDKAMPVVIGFLANLAGLGDIAQPLQKGLAAVRTRVDTAIDFLIDKGKGLLNFLGGGGSKGDKQKLGEEVDWTQEGESHRLWIEDHGGSPVVMMASTAAPVEEQLAKFRTEADAQDSSEARKHIAQATKKNKALNDLIRTVIELNVKAGSANGSVSPSAAKEKQIVTAQENLVASLKEIEDDLGLSGKTFGSKDNPIPLPWQKPRLTSYRTLYFGPKSDEIIPQSKLQEAYQAKEAAKRKVILKPFLGLKWDPKDEEFGLYRPEARKALPKGGKEIGVTSDWQVAAGMTIQMTNSFKSGGGRKLNGILKPYGFSPDSEDLEADHIVERQMGGPDELENLWPLQSSKNGGGGSRLNTMKFPCGTQKFVLHLKHPGKDDLTMDEVKAGVRKKPVFFRIVSTME